MGNGSGNAETVSCGTNPTGIEIRPETAGKVLVGTEAIIVDPETLEEKNIMKKECYVFLGSMYLKNIIKILS